MSFTAALHHLLTAASVFALCFIRVYWRPFAVRNRNLKPRIDANERE